jgi:diguanylate cyclase (GGDEF)-like protein/PAS domain S-box-containing protein
MSTNYDKIINNRKIRHNYVEKSFLDSNITPEVVDSLPPDKAKAMLKEVLNHQHELENQSTSENIQYAALFKQKDTNYFDAFFYSSPVSKTIYQLNQKNQLILTGSNPAAEKLLGTDLTLLVGRTIAEVFPGLELNNIYDTYPAIARGELNTKHHEQYYNDERLTGWFEVTVFRAYKNTVCLDISDISQRRLVEDELKERLDNFEKIFNLSEYMVCIASPKGAFLKVSSAFSETLGFSKKDLLAKPFVNFVHPDDKKATADNMERLELGKPVTRFPNRYRCKNGSYKWFEWTACTFVKGGDTYAIVYDITDRKLANQKILKSESFAKATIDASSSTICVLSKEGEILAVNQAWRKFYDENKSNLTPHEYFVGTNYYAVCNDGSQESTSVINGISQVANNEIGNFSAEYSCHSPTEQRWFNLQVSPFKDGSGNVVVTHENITERKLSQIHEESRIHVLELMANDERLPIILEAIVQGVEHVNPALLCSISLLDEAGKHLLHGAAPSLTDFYNSAINGTEIGLGIGSCGTAAFTNERVIVDDIHSHPYCTAYKELASKAKLGACWSEPIRCKKGNVLGTFATYQHGSYPPIEGNLSLIEQAMSLATIAIEKAQTKITLFYSEERYSLAMKGTQDGLWDWNVLTGKVVYGERWKSMLGYKADEIQDNFSEWKRLVHPDDLDKALLSIQEFFNNTTNKYEAEFRMQHKNGLYLNILSRAFASENGKGKITRLVGTHIDITDRKQAEERLKLAASVFTHAREAIVITDDTATIIDVNQAFIRRTGFSHEETIGQYPNFLKSAQHTSEFSKQIWHALQKNGYWCGEVCNQRKNGEQYTEMVAISAVCDNDGIVTHFVVLGNDITHMKEHQEQLEHIAHYDPLTNLPNRVLLADRLSQTMLRCKRDGRSLAVVFLDLDGFKKVNDTHGHSIGDELLIALSVRMKQALRKGDSFSRIGGDEFVAVLTDLNTVEDCEPLLQRLLQAASQPIIVDDMVLNVSASIGVTLYPQDDVGADQLMRHADQAMYVAKGAGKNCYNLFDTAQDNAVKFLHESLDAIRMALDNREFVLYYQPKINMKKGTVIGFEALIRWQHPSRGLLGPIEFLHFIENNPVSIEIGEWVIDSALSQISCWQKMDGHLPLNISVNIAALQLQQPDFTQRLKVLLAAHPDVEPHNLELEVLETSSLDDVNYISTVMCDCIALGVKFALDDFGTGYSSLTYLRRLPASLIKIDQSFVCDMLSNSEDLAIVEGVIALAKLFNRDVIAEGVETVEHGTALLQLGCDFAQGYGIARPMPVSDIPDWLSGWKPDANWLS